MEVEKVVKWVGIGLITIIVLMVVTGNMGGSREATKNYNEVMTGKK